MFIESISFGIFNALQAKEYKNFTNLLKNARRIENYRKNVTNNFFFNKKKLERTNKHFASNRDVFKTTIQISSVRIVVTNIKFAHLNEKFGSVNKKPDDWIKSWFDEKRNSEKLTNENKNKLTKQNKCWSCKESRHRKNDAVCINADRRNDVRLNKTIVTFQRISEIESDTSSKSRKEWFLIKIAIKNRSKMIISKTSKFRCYQSAES